MVFRENKLSGSYTIELTPFQDDRGWFARTFCENEFSQIGFDKKWVQINHSFTKNRGSVRGLHYQVPPFSETRLVRCISGAVFDVIVDLRKDSKTKFQWFGLELSAANRKMMFIPEGFAHGFQCLSDDCELTYHHTNFYNPEFEGGFKYDDPILGIKWPDKITFASERDTNLPYIDPNFEGLKFN